MFESKDKLVDRLKKLLDLLQIKRQKTERHKDRKTEEQKDGETERQKNRKAEGLKYRKAEGLKYRKTERQKSTYTDPSKCSASSNLTVRLRVGKACYRVKRNLWIDQKLL